MQDISCYGSCSITVALPILNAYGFETAILPSAILSTHTAGFKNFTVLDLKDELPKIINHWQNENIKFDLLYSGYLGDTSHFDILRQIKNNLLNDKLFVLDPVMGDNGKLYPAFNQDYVKKMQEILPITNIIIPNLTEACLLTGVEYKETYDFDYIDSIISKLKALGAKDIVLTGISFKKDKTGVLINHDGKTNYYEHDKIPVSFHGTGDIFSASFIGAYLRTNDIYQAGKIAADFVVLAIQNSLGDQNHLYGVKYEPLLANYISETFKKTA